MSTQTFACPACGSRKTLGDASPGEKIHCTCGMSFPASPVFAVAEAGEAKTSGPGLAVAVAVALLIGCGGSAIWIMTRPKPAQSPLGPVAANPQPVVPQPNVPDEQPNPAPSPDPEPVKPAPVTPDKPAPDKAPPPPPPPAPPVASIAAVTLFDAYDLDPAAANARFGGKVVEVTGRGRVFHNSIGRAYFGAIIMSPGAKIKGRMTDQVKQWEKEGYPPSVRCYLTDEQAAALENVPPDQNVVLRGTCIGRKDIDGVYHGYIVELDNCTVVNK
jgi:hypothetical protein